MTTAPSPERFQNLKSLTNSSNKSVPDFRHSPDITRAAQWLADRQIPNSSGFVGPLLPTLKARFGLTDADAAEAILLAGDFSVVRRAFG